MMSIQEFLTDRAAQMAAHDNVAVDVAYILGAANQLQTELITARDQLLLAAMTPIPASAPQDEPEVVEAPAATEAAPMVDAGTPQ